LQSFFFLFLFFTIVGCRELIRRLWIQFLKLSIWETIYSHIKEINKLQIYYCQFKISLSAPKYIFFFLRKQIQYISFIIIVLIQLGITSEVTRETCRKAVRARVWALPFSWRWRLVKTTIKSVWFECKVLHSSISRPYSQHLYTLIFPQQSVPSHLRCKLPY
jgi:hypothetical protein